MTDQATTSLRCPRCGSEHPIAAAFCSRCGIPTRPSPLDTATATSNVVRNQEQTPTQRGAASSSWSTVLAWALCGAALLGVSFMLGVYHQYTLDCIALNPNRWVPDSPTNLYQRAIGWRDDGVVVGAFLGGGAGFLKTVADRRRAVR